MAYQLDFTDQAKEDIAAHQKAGNKAVLNKLLKLLNELAGCWSRRINQEHRLVYQVTDEVVYVLSSKGHY